MLPPHQVEADAAYRLHKSITRCPRPTPHDSILACLYLQSRILVRANQLRNHISMAATASRTNEPTCYTCSRLTRVYRNNLGYISKLTELIFREKKWLLLVPIVSLWSVDCDRALLCYWYVLRPSRVLDMRHGPQDTNLAPIFPLRAGLTRRTENQIIKVRNVSDPAGRFPPTGVFT